MGGGVSDEQERVSGQDPVDRARQRRGDSPVPRPIVGLIALGFAGAAIWNLVFDAYTPGYEGSKLSIFFGTLALFALGYDVSKIFRGGGS